MFPTQPLTPRFGWSGANPPDPKRYVIRLQPRDVGPQNQPTDAFVQRVAKELVGESDDTPRFTVIPNVLDVLRSGEAARQFQVGLAKKVHDLLGQRHPDQMAIGGRPGQAFPVYLNRSGGMASTKLHHDIRSGNESVRGCNENPIISLLYGRNDPGVEGGYPVFADDRQYLRDLPPQGGIFGYFKKKLKPEDIFKKPAPSEVIRFVPPHSDAITRNYRIVVDKTIIPELDFKNNMTIAIFNNTFHGVAHAGSPVTTSSPHDRRRLGHISVQNNPTQYEQRPDAEAAYIRGEGNL